MYRNIQPTEFKTLLSQATYELIDVRTPEEVQQGIIPGARIIDIHNPDFENLIDQLDKTKSYLVYCRSGARSAMACRMMREKGFSGDLCNLATGIFGWPDELVKP